LRKKYKYIVFNLNKDSTEIVIDGTGNEGYEDFLDKALPVDECRWAIYDFEYEKEGAGRRNKIIFLSW
jgi:cofilin